MIAPTCLLINDDEAALQELAGLLTRQGHAKKIFSANGVVSARRILDEQHIDLLFIRVKAWDEYRKIIPLLGAPPRIVIFLSGRKERSALRLEKEVDFYLSAPYRISAVNKLFVRLKDASFVPRSLNFFFIKADRQYYAVAFSALRAVSSKGRMLTLQTDKAEYQIAGSLSGLQERLPPLFCRVGPSLLVAGQEVMGGYSPRRPSGNIFSFY
jgi:DNA-binding LytR/AlgR family response regulator